MQSVFKLPLALTVLHHVEQGEFSLDQPVRFLPQDRILPHAYSPLQDQYPDAGIDVPLHELLRLAVSLSDNVAADILLRMAGGTKAVNAYIASLGITGFIFGIMRPSFIVKCRRNTATGLSRRERCNCFARSATIRP